MQLNWRQNYRTLRLMSRGTLDIAVLYNLGRNPHGRMGVPLIRMDAEMRVVDSPPFLYFQIKGVQRRSLSTCVDFCLDKLNAKIGQANPFTPADDFLSQKTDGNSQEYLVEIVST